MNNTSESKYKSDKTKSNTLLMALIGILGTGLGASISGIMDIRLEREELRSNLILKAVETEDPQSAIDYLKFLRNSKLVDGLDPVIDTLEKNPSAAPLRPAIDSYKGIFSIDRNIRRQTLQFLLNNNVNDINLIKTFIKNLEIENFKTLSPESKVNIVYFLNRTDFAVWTPSMKNDANDYIRYIKKEVEEERMYLGPQVKGEIENLEIYLTKKH
jgi:hypothetical protein